MILIFQIAVTGKVKELFGITEEAPQPPVASPPAREPSIPLTSAFLAPKMPANMEEAQKKAAAKLYPNTWSNQSTLDRNPGVIQAGARIMMDPQRFLWSLTANQSEFMKAARSEEKVGRANKGLPPKRDRSAATRAEKQQQQEEAAFLAEGKFLIGLATKSDVNDVRLEALRALLGKVEAKDAENRAELAQIGDNIKKIAALNPSEAIEQKRRDLVDRKMALEKQTRNFSFILPTMKGRVEFLTTRRINDALRKRGDKARKNERALEGAVIDLTEGEEGDPVAAEQQPVAEPCEDGEAGTTDS